MKSLQADFFKVMKEGAIQYAAPLPFLDLICVGTATQTEVKEQIDLMYSLIHQQVDAIVLVPIDSKALVQPAAGKHFCACRKFLFIFFYRFLLLQHVQMPHNPMINGMP